MTMTTDPLTKSTDPMAAASPAPTRSGRTRYLRHAVVLAKPDDFMAAVGQHFGHYGHHLRGADIETDDQVFRVFCHVF